MLDLNRLVSGTQDDDGSLVPSQPLIRNEHSFSSCLYVASHLQDLPFAWVLLVHCEQPDRRSLVLGKPRRKYPHDGELNPPSPPKRVFIETDSLRRAARVCLVFLRRLFYCRLL